MSADDPGLIPLDRVRELWSMDYILVEGTAIYTMWRKGQLHSLAVVGNDLNNKVYIPIRTWAELRTLGDRLHVPTACYINVEEEVYYCKWPVISGLMYPVMRSTSGGVVSIPATEFQMITTKGGNT